MDVEGFIFFYGSLVYTKEVMHFFNSVMLFCELLLLRPMLRPMGSSEDVCLLTMVPYRCKAFCNFCSLEDLRLCEQATQNAELLDAMCTYLSMHTL